VELRKGTCAVGVNLCTILLDLIGNEKRIKTGGLRSIFPSRGVGIIMFPLGLPFVVPSHLVLMTLDIAKVILEFTLFFDEIINPLATVFKVTF